MSFSLLKFNMAKVIPGKEEFYETIRYFKNQLELHGVDVRLGTEATPALLEGYDSVVLATGKSYSKFKFS
jgi:2,4-dienoyl-CoA reductase (NADPH2)